MLLSDQSKRLWLEIGANVNFQDRSDGDRAVDWGANQENAPFSLKYDESRLRSPFSSEVYPSH